MCVKLSCDGLMFACWCVVLTALRSFCLLLLVFLARSLFLRLAFLVVLIKLVVRGFGGSDGQSEIFVWRVSEQRTALCLVIDVL